MRLVKYTKTEKEPKLDLKDKKILYWLADNARTPYTKIAKKVAFSKHAVKYRIKNLEKKGVIQGYIAQIDIAKLGYETYHIFLQLNKLNKEVMNKLIEILKSYNFIKAIIEFSGKYNLEISIVAKNIEELDKNVTKIIDDVSQYLQNYEILTISKYYTSRVFPKSFMSLEENKIKKFHEGRIDKTDLKILNVLSQDAVRPLYKIANQIKLSADAVKYRIKKLQEQGLIIGYRPVINFSSIGYTIYAVLMNVHNLSTEKEKRLRYFLETSKHLLWAVKAIGKYNLLMYICVKKSDEFHQTLIKLRELFSSDIKDYETLIAYESYKYTYLPEVCAEA